MPSIIYDALACADINSLLREAASIVADTLVVDHVLILEVGAIHSQSCSCSSIGWEQSKALQLGKSLLARESQAEAAHREETTTGDGPLQAGGYRVSASLLQEYGLAAALFSSVPCGRGSLLLFAGTTRANSLSMSAYARSLRAAVTLLSLAIRRASAELGYIARLQQVVQAKHQWQSTVDALPQLVCLIDEHGFVIRANRTLELWQLGEVRSIRGTQVHDMLHPGCTDAGCDLWLHWKQMWQQLNATQFAECALHDLVPGYELHLSLCRVNPSRYDDGAAEQGYAFLLIEDISEQKRHERLLVNYNTELERQLQEQSAQLKMVNAQLKGEIREHTRHKAVLIESEKKYACFVENALTGIYALRNNRIVFCNKRFADIFAYERNEIYQLELHELFPADKQGTAANLTGEEKTVKGTTRAGGTVWVRRNLGMLDCFREPMILGTVVDITAQKNAEDELRRSEQELKLLSEQLLLAQEDERKRIALELHDGIGQTLSAIKFGLENAMQECDKKTREQNAKYLASVVDKLRDAIEEVRNISMGLRPSMLDDLGLAPTISWFCREFQSLHPTIRMTKRIDIEERNIADVLKVVVFRIIQEALNNIAKHAGASNVSVELASTGEALELRIEDDGRGIPPEAFRLAKGLGLSSIKERAKLSGGNLTIEATVGTGTVIQVVWPFPQARING
jgi:PAS domain S-box-containing protein